MNALARRLRGLGVGADTTLTLVLQVLGAVAGFVLQVVIFRVLSKDDAGYFVLTTTYLVLASAIADFGIAATVMPRLAVAGGESPAFKAAVVARFVAILVSWLVMNIYLLLSGSEDLLPYLNIGYFGMFVSARLIGLRQFIEIIWRLQGRTYVITAVALADSVLLTGGILILAALDALTLVGVFVLFALAGLPGFLLIVWPLWKSGRLQLYFSRTIPGRYYRTLLTASLPVAAMVLAGQAFSQLEILVIEGYLQLADNAGFRAATAPLSGLIFLSTAISFGLSPVISQIHRGSRHDIGAGMLTSIAVRLIGTIALGICAVCFLFSEQLMMLFGPKYSGEAPILRIYSIASGLTFLVVLFDMFLLAIGMRRQVLVAAIFGLSIALGLELLLVRGYGVPGLVLAKVVALVVILLLQLRAMMPDLRGGALSGLRLLVLPAALLGVVLIATTTFDAIYRIPLVLLVFGGALVVGRIVTPAEIQLLRRLRIS